MEKTDFTRLDLSGIFAKTEDCIEFDIVLPKDTLFLDGTMQVSEVCAKGKIYTQAQSKSKSEELVMLDMNIAASYTDLCARCLEEIKGDINIPYTACVVRALSDENKDDEYIVAKDSLLDLLEVIKTVFMLELPTRSLCREDCRGLCQVCGANLNETECGCSKKAVDPRLEKLRELLSKD